jgi:hypothetical protein
MTQTNCRIHPEVIDGGTSCALCQRVEAVKVEVRKRVPKDEDSPGCFMCKWIMLDLEANGKLKGWNLDQFGKPIFSREGELAHLKIEGIEFLEAAL